MGRHIVDRADNFPAGSRRAVDIGGRSIAIFNRGDRYFALRNVCPHHGAPLVTHGLRGTMTANGPGDYRYARGGEIVRCPWHGYEYSAEDGRCLADPALRVKVYRVEVEDDEVVLYT